MHSYGYINMYNVFLHVEARGICLGSLLILLISLHLNFSARVSDCIQCTLCVHQSIYIGYILTLDYFIMYGTIYLVYISTYILLTNTL